ncbi:MAG: ABC transporter permease, partial [Longimicrobiales bacterium]
LLRRALPADVRSSVQRDLEEMAEVERARRSRVGVRIWVWRQVMSFCAHFALERARERLGTWRFARGRAVRRERWWSGLDVRYAVRTLVRAPLMTLAAVLCLAVGVALPVAGFSVLSALFLQPLPFPEGERIVRLREVHAQRGYDLDVTAAEYERRRARLTSYEVLAAYDLESVEVASVAATSGLSSGAYVTPELFELARLPPLIGRVITAADVEPGAPPVAVIGEGLWRRWFGGDGGALGQKIRVKGEAHTVIGVLPARFGFPGERVEVWLPLGTRAHSTRASSDVKVVGLIRPGISLRRAESELAALLPAERTDVDDASAVVADVLPFAQGAGSLSAFAFGWAMIVALVLLLMVAAANVANLLLARNAARGGELAVRTALGASRRRLMAQLLLEALMLSALATVAGALLARTALVRLQGVLVLPAWSQLGLDARVLFFAMVLALLAALVSGAGPAWKATRPELHGVLKTMGRGGDTIGFGRLSGALIVTELCLSVALLGVAAVFARGMFEFGRTEVMIASDDVLVVQLYWGSPPEVRGDAALTDVARGAAWAAHEEVAAREQARIATSLAGVASVRAATFASHVPSMPLEASPIELEGDDATVLASTRVVAVRPGFFDTLDVRLLAGRDFRIDETRAEAAVALVNESFARRHFGGPSGALGGRVRQFQAGTQSPQSVPWLEIVGVVPDLGLNPGDPVHGDGLYLPMGGDNVAELIVRVSADVQEALPRVIEAERAVNPDIEMQWTTTLADAVGLPARIFRGIATAFVLAGVIALVLSMLSLYALMSFSVTRRTREIGIRVAIGAPPRSVLGSVLGRGLRQMLLGVSLGAALGLALTRIAVASIPFDLVRGGPVELAVIAVLLSGAGFVACLRPVRRVLTVNAIHAIHSE